MSSERKDNCAANFLWSASKLIQDLSNRNTSRGSDLTSMCIAFRARRFNYMNFNKEKLHLCPKCYTPWKEGRFSMRIRANRVSKSHRKRIIFQVVRCNVCQNKCISIVSKPEKTFLNTGNTLQPEKPEPVGKVSTNKKKIRRKDHLAGLNFVNVPPSNYNSGRAFNKNLKQNNSEELSDKSTFTNVHINLVGGKNVAMDGTKLSIGVNSNNIEQSNPLTSNNLINTVSTKCFSLIKDTNNTITYSIKSRNSKKKENNKKKKFKVNHLKNFIHSL